MLAARRILVTVGYNRMTMRAVAREAGLAVGNLGYYFPAKHQLVHALIASLVAQYQDKSDEYLRRAGRKDRAGFASLVQWFIYDSVSPDTSRLFRELWAMSLHDDKVASAMDEFYAQAHRTAASLLRLAHPALSSQRAHDIVQLMGTVSEGANVIYGTAGRSRSSLQRVATLAADLLVHAAGGRARRRINS
ncbi:MAG: TetR/AcrR family transcriptional regulator [Pseudomonadota bacterium]|nr:TetR/AcrR family transcriptional regulator [Pseudomonadota bacterium]